MFRPLRLMNPLGSSSTALGGQPHVFSGWSRWLGLGSATIGGLVLLGWGFDLGFLKSLHPGWVTMKANTALGFLLLGLGVALLPVRWLGIPVALLGLATLVEIGFGLDLGIDQAIFPEAPGAVSTPHLGRMSPVTAWAFVLAGSGLSLLPRRPAWAQVLTLPVVLLGLISVLGYLFGVEAFYRVGSFTSMALHTALGFILVGLGILLAKPFPGRYQALRGEGLAALIFRKSVPAIVVIPLVLGWLRLQGEKAGHYSLEMGTGAYAGSMILMFLVVQIIGALHIHRLEEARQAAEADTHRMKEEMQALLDAAPAAIYLKDSTGRFTFLNQQVAENLERDREAILGRNIRDFLPAQEAALIEADEQRVVREGVSIQSEIRTSLPHGVQTFLIMKFPVFNQAGEVSSVGGVATNITDRIEAEDALRKARDAAEAASRELEAFSYTVAHDLRAPLRAIDGFSRILEEDCEASLDAEGKGYLARIRAGSQRMAQLIDDLLALSRLSKVDLVKEPVDMSSMAEEILRELRRRDPGRRVETQVEGGLQAWADQRYLRIALENLLGNSWKFSSRNPAARIEVGAESKPDGRTYFIKDNGAGFEMDYAGKLFMPFQRLHPAQEFEGNGIGLATVDRVIRRHGGHIWAEGIPGLGAIFHFSIPEGGIP